MKFLDDEFEVEQGELAVIINKILDLMTDEASRQLDFNDHSHKALKELDEYIKTFEESDSLLNVMTALRTSFRASPALKNWQPLLEHALKKWPEDRKSFVGLVK